MIEIVYSTNFVKSARKLPKAQLRKLVVLTGYLRENPYDPRLHSKHLSSPLIGLLSFRITRDWRVLFRFMNESTIELVEVAHRSSVYRR